MIKMKRTIAFCLIVVSGALESVLGDPLTFKIEGDTAVVIDCDPNASGKIVIPSEYEGKLFSSV